jgi:hypothetical protein
MKKWNLIIVLSLLLLGQFFCVEDNTSVTDEDKKNLVLAIAAKASECGGVGPNFVAFPIDEKVERYSVQGCTLAILQAQCPFETYPLICIEIYKVDYPYAGPKIK